MSEYFSRRPDTEAKFIDAFTVTWHPYLCYLFPYFGLLPGVLQKIPVEQEQALIVEPYWPTQPWISQMLNLVALWTPDLQTHCNKFDITTRFQSQTPISRKAVTDGGSIIQEKYRKLGYSGNTRNILLVSWRPGALKSYSKYMDLWKEFASMNSFDIFSNRVQNVLDFLSKLFSDGHSYSQMNTASSILSSIITINKVPCGKHPDVKII